MRCFGVSRCLSTTWLDGVNLYKLRAHRQTGIGVDHLQRDPQRNQSRPTGQDNWAQKEADGKRTDAEVVQNPKKIPANLRGHYRIDPGGRASFRAD